MKQFTRLADKKLYFGGGFFSWFLLCVHSCFLLILYLTFFL